MEAYNSANVVLNFSEMSRTTSGSYNKAKTNVNTQLRGIQELVKHRHESMECVNQYFLRSQSDLNSLRSDTSWTEGYSKFLEELEGEEFLRDAPAVESRNRVTNSAKTLKTGIKRMRRFVTTGIISSYNFALKL